jgi:hypothetical protein
MMFRQNIESNDERKNTNIDIQDIPPITELNSGWTSTQDLLPRISYKDGFPCFIDGWHLDLT